MGGRMLQAFIKSTFHLNKHGETLEISLSSLPFWLCFYYARRSSFLNFLAHRYKAAPVPELQQRAR